MLVVGIGASAGGLEAISKVLTNVPADAGIAIIVVQHLDPHHASLLVELLQKTSVLPVEWAEDRAEIGPGRVYVAPSGRTLSFDKLALKLTAPTKRHVDGIDACLRSLAETFAHRAVAVILSGNGTDGALGVRAVKGSGGIAFAQRPSTAQFPSMPRAAIETGCVDRVLEAAEIGVELGKLRQESHAAWEQIEKSDPGAGREDASHLSAIFRLVAARTGVDFSVYKPNTINRRLARRMMLRKTPNAADYLKLLKQDPKEADELHESMLINVTEFFRDPACFEFLRKEVLPKIIERHADGSPVRIWVPGCATGEEVYTYGILLREIMEDQSRVFPVQIFGTDISDAAIAFARAGVFSAAEAASVGPERLQRFFHAVERGYLIQKPIRDMCVFARQNIFKDAPFSKLDLLSCRNLLIYLNPATQRKLIPLFHYALNGSGVLVLGHSESVNGHSDLFRPVDPRFRIYAPRPTKQHAVMDFPVDQHRAAPEQKTVKLAPTMAEPTKDSFDAIREADRIVAAHRGPPGFLVNEQWDIVQFRGEVMPFTAPASGRATLKLLDMARDGLAGELRVALTEAREKNVRVQRPGVSVMQGGSPRPITLEVTPFTSLQTREQFFLVEFVAEPANTAPEPKPAIAPAGNEAAYLAQIAQLRRDLDATRNYLQSTIEKNESANQDLRAANEEIQSANEELQSTNEELETAKEELQSTNEELSTVNEELHHRQLALMQANNDLTNLISSFHLPILILGHDLTIRRFTPAAEKLFNLIPSDVGRPLSDINTNLALNDLAKRVADTIESLVVSECEVQGNDGRWYSMRLRPYKTAENKIEGAVVTLIDIDEIKRAMTQIASSRDFERAVFETTREPLAALDGDLRIRAANRAFYELFGLERERPETRLLLDATRERGTFMALQKALLAILPKGANLTDERVEIQMPGDRAAAFLVNARQIVGDQPYPLILLSLQKVP